MKKKIIGIFVCTLLITIIALPATGTINNSKGVENEKNSNKPLDRGWYYYPSYPNYSPSGIPDFANEQENWKTILDGGNGIAESTAEGDDVQVTEVGEPIDPTKPVVVAPGPNCNLDSTTGGDDWSGFTYCHAVSLANIFWWFDSRYSKVDGNPGDGKDSFPLVEDYGGGDDHSSENVPCLVCEIANHLNITSTIYLNLYTWTEDIAEWFENVGLDKGFKITDYEFPSFELIAEAIENDKSVVLLIQFGRNVNGQCVGVASHFVSCAGVNYDQKKIALSDPNFDIDNPTGDNHNDPQYVSYDIYDVTIGSPCSNYPQIKWWLPSYWPSSSWNYAIIGYAVIIECTNNVPNAPTIDGPTEGSKDITYDYILNSVDPDGNDVYYHILWGDGVVDDTTIVPSGTNVTVSHSWKIARDYTIQVTATDNFNEESNVSTLVVTIPRYKSIFYLWNPRILMFFPMLERLLTLFVTFKY